MGFISAGNILAVKRPRKTPQFKRRKILVKPVETAVDTRPPQRLVSTEVRALRLTDLPLEIILQIACYTGFGSDNMLPFTCRYFNRVLSPSLNRWIIEMAVKSHFSAHLNKDIDRSFWELKFQEAASLLPEHFKDSPIMDSLMHVPVAVARTSRAIDLRIFHFSFVDAEIVRQIHSKFGGILLDTQSILDEQKHRKAFLEWRLLVLQKFVCLATEPDQVMEPHTNEVAEDLLNRAESTAIGYRQKHDLADFTPQVKSHPQRFPGENISTDKLEVIILIHRLYETEILDASSLLYAAFQSNYYLNIETVTDLLGLLPPSMSSKDVLNLLKVFELCRKRLHASSEGLQASQSLKQITEQLHDLIRTVLSSQYRLDQDEDSRLIWQALVDIQIPELLDYVLKSGGAVSLDLI